MMKTLVVILMGAAGAGKTTVGKAAAARLGWEFLDADDFHDRANVDRMSRGVPLTDADRLPWLDRLRRLLSERVQQKKSVVLACSALKRSYQKVLQVSPAVQLAYLKAPPALLRERLKHREGHYLHPSLLDSQLFVLEEPRNALILDAALPVEALAEAIAAHVTAASAQASD
jgi:gluconokinase